MSPSSQPAPVAVLPAAWLVTGHPRYAAVHNRHGLLPESAPVAGHRPALVRGLWQKVAAWQQATDEANRRRVAAGFRDMWREARRRHPQYFERIAQAPTL